MEGDQLNCWVKGNEFSISTMSIQYLLQIQPVIPMSFLPYDKRKTPVSKEVPDLGGEWKRQSLNTTSFSPNMRTLAYIMLFNFYPVQNLTTLSQPQVLFLHGLYKKKNIDIYAYIYHLLAKCVIKKKRWLYHSWDWLCLSCIKRGSRFPQVCQS